MKNNDKLATWCFAEAGRKLAHHLIAIQKKIPEEMKLEAGGMKVIIIGSVWKSWPLMREPFLKGENNQKLTKFAPIVPLTPNSAPVDGACLSVAATLIFLATICLDLR